MRGAVGKEDEGAGRGEGVLKVTGLLPGRLAHGRGKFKREGEGKEGIRPKEGGIRGKSK